MTEKYYLVIEYNGKIVTQSIFDSINRQTAEKYMDAFIRQVVEVDMKDEYNINLYQMTWINGI